MLCLSDSLSISFKLQELSQPTSSQDCSTGEQIPGDLWSSPSLERFEIVILELEKVLKSFSAALPALPAELGPVPHPAQGTAWALLGQGCVCTWPGDTCKVVALLHFVTCLEAGSVAIPEFAGLSSSVGTACDTTSVGTWLGTVDVHKVRKTDLESCPCS